MTVNETLVLQIDELGGANVLAPGKFGILCPLCNSQTKEIIFTQNGKGSFEAFAECGCPIRQVISGLRRAVELETNSGNGNGHAPEQPRFNEPRYSEREKAPDERTVFPLITFDQLCALPPPKWQIEDLFLEQSLVQVYGETNHGKSLLLWDLVCTICAGIETWFGREIIKPGPVIWVNADGGLGLTLRAQAWAEAHNIKQMKYPLLTLMGAVHLNRADQIGAFRRQIMGLDEPPALTLFDTQSRCMAGGRENDADEMTLVTEGMHRLKQEAKCSVLPIHHTDKSGQWERGSGVVKNESDTQIRVSKDEDSGIFTVKCKKARDHPPFEDFFFRAKPVLDSVVIEQHNAPPPKNPVEEKLDRQDHALLYIRELPGRTCEQLGGFLNVSKRTAERYAEALEEKRLIFRQAIPAVGFRKPEVGLYAHPSDNSDTR